MKESLNSMRVTVSEKQMRRRAVLRFCIQEYDIRKSSPPLTGWLSVPCWGASMTFVRVITLQESVSNSCRVSLRTARRACRSG